MCVPGTNAFAAEFHITSSSVSTLAVTIYVLGMAIGPMVTSPLSETYGRLPVYHSTNLVFLAFLIGCALSRNLAQFMVFRFISGLAGGTPMALGGGTIADVTRPEGRSVAMALFSLGPLTGPVSLNGKITLFTPQCRFSTASSAILTPIIGPWSCTWRLLSRWSELAVDLLVAGYSKRRCVYYSCRRHARDTCKCSP